MERALSKNRNKLAEFTLSDDVSVLRNDDVYRTLSTYSYGTGANYALGQVTQIDALNWKDGNTWPTNQTVNTYAWRDGPVLDLTVFNGAWSTDYRHDIVGGQAQLARAVIADGRPRTVSFVNDFLGQGIKRDEADTLGGGDPHEIWYRFSGRQQAYVGNNGTIDIDYMNSVGQKQQGGPNPGSYADFDLAYDPINAWEQGSRGGTYTVQAGDTLAGIAAALWGDANLWYKIAEVNGLTAESQLIEGMPLLIPVGVVRSSNTAETFKPYDPLLGRFREHPHANARGSLAAPAPECESPRPKKKRQVPLVFRNKRGTNEFGGVRWLVGWTQRLRSGRRWPI